VGVNMANSIWQYIYCALILNKYYSGCRDSISHYNPNPNPNPKNLHNEIYHRTTRTHYEKQKASRLDV